MNKTLTIVAIAAISMLAACKKDYVCTCNVKCPADTVNKINMPPLNDTMLVDIQHAKQSEAESQCTMSKDYLDRTFAQYPKRTIDCKLED